MFDTLKSIKISLKLLSKYIIMFCIESIKEKINNYQSVSLNFSKT